VQVTKFTMALIQARILKNTARRIAAGLRFVGVHPRCAMFALRWLHAPAGLFYSSSVRNTSVRSILFDVCSLNELRTFQFAARTAAEGTLGLAKTLCSAVPLLMQGGIQWLIG
jgi:hypothetical protein